MPHRNDLLAAQSRIASLENELAESRRENARLRRAESRADNRRAEKRSRKVRARKSGRRFGFRYERPKTFFPLLEDWDEMRHFFTTPSSDSVLEWLFARVFGSLCVYLFFTPITAALSIPALPFVVLSGVRIGPRSR
jgi:hypothetical protein